MFKVISAEIKKILSKPSIYILAIILAGILVLGVFIYNPTPQKSNTFVLTGSTFTAKYEAFYSSNGYKATSDSSITKTISSINSYSITENGETISRKQYIEKLYNTVLNEFYAYRNFAAYNEDLTDQMLAQKEKLTQSIQLLKTQIDQSIQLSLTGSYSMLTTNANHAVFIDLFKEIESWLDVTPEQSTLANHCKVFESNLKPQLGDCINAFIYPTLTKEIINNYTSLEENSKLSNLYSRLNKIEDEISALNNIVIENGDLENKKQASKMDELANLYVQTAQTYTNLVKYELLCNAFSSTLTKQQLDLLYLKDYSNYNNKSLLVKYSYLFDNNKTILDYSNPLTIGATSNQEINAYDYAYFIIKLFSFVIIAYSIMLACNSIAGEIKEGSMRYFAIRPISRTEIYFGKLLAIIILSSILILFSAIIAICVGGTVYRFESLNILTIFNGTHAVVLKPITMLAIYLLSFIIEVAIYASIGLLFSTLIKSDVLSVTIMLVFYLINILLPLFIQGANTVLSYYPFSHISLYTLFGSAVYATNDFFNLLLGAKVYATTNLGLTIIVIIALIAIINIIAAKIFKHKEL